MKQTRYTMGTVKVLQHNFTDSKPFFFCRKKKNKKRKRKKKKNSALHPCEKSNGPKVNHSKY
jgi:hypothetical protein